jgi:hypothetical protein
MQEVKLSKILPWVILIVIAWVIVKLFKSVSKPGGNQAPIDPPHGAHDRPAKGEGHPK